MSDANTTPDESKFRPVFVVGTGRSGTHWLGHTLGAHPEVRATVEQQPMFDLSTRMALDPSLERRLFPRLIEAYRRQLSLSGGRLYLDKTHPNLWLAERLQRAFPGARFLGIERDPYATVASMMQHGGVAAWHRRWKEFPVPNRFLGITREAAAGYADLPLATQCAMRWRAHHRRMKALQSRLGSAMLTISYESLARDAEAGIEELRSFLGLIRPLPMPEVKSESLTKWKGQLSQEQIEQIRGVVGPAYEADAGGSPAAGASSMHGAMLS